MVATLVLEINPESPDLEKIRFAARVIREGGLVAFPTETVYGLGANALDEAAVQRIFQVKNRPMDNPLIVHIADRDDVHLLAETVPAQAERLIETFWPGPLTLLLPKSELVPAVTTAGLATVAVRMPSHPIAQSLIREADVPVAAPSANLAGRPSPTSARHVWEDLSGKIEILIDGGEVGYGVESTVLDVTSDPPVLLRPGPITVTELRRVLGRVEVHPIARAEMPVEAAIAKAPGMKYRHYAPRAELVLVEGPPQAVVAKIRELAAGYDGEGKRVGIMAVAETAAEYGLALVKVVGERRNPRTIAKGLFRTLREFDAENVNVILAEGVEPTGIGLAIMNRLRKAAANIVRAG
ncbi:MAG: L-threonylcarbamoyladenylate synthase [Candidatus Hadarchaeum sp.]|uniref:L-threonylcarbamoyladenylate synthase n=1 Tax=Candidatus Hadarchaeum sp. TaxID=2883567 RepID=UPI003D0A5B18